MAQGRKIDVDAVIDNILTEERGAAPANPDTSKWRLYFKAGGLYYLEDDGTEVGPLTGVWPDIGARVYNSGDISINDSANTILTFDSERYDTDGIHSTVANTSRLTCKTTGKYLIICQIYWDNQAAGVRQIQLLLNGATALVMDRAAGQAGTLPMIHECVTIYVLAVNDYVEAEAYQDHGAALDVLAGGNFSPEFMMQRIG